MGYFSSWLPGYLLHLHPCHRWRQLKHRCEHAVQYLQTSSLWKLPPPLLLLSLLCPCNRLQWVLAGEGRSPKSQRCWLLPRSDAGSSAQTLIPGLVQCWAISEGCSCSGWAQLPCVLLDPSKPTLHAPRWHLRPEPSIRTTQLSEG